MTEINPTFLTTPEEVRMAPLGNITIFNQLIETLKTRPSHLPGIATFHGFSGYGKTFSATCGANQYGAANIHVGWSWTPKVLCKQILDAINIDFPKNDTLHELVKKIIKALSYEKRILIIDEADYLVNRKMCDLIREIHDGAKTPIILIGEENLPKNLKESERFHNRILKFQPAQGVTVKDCQELAKLYSKDIAICPELMKRVHEKSTGQVRRVVTSIELLRNHAKNNGLNKVTLTADGKSPIDLQVTTPLARKKIELDINGNVKKPSATTVALEKARLKG